MRESYEEYDGGEYIVFRPAATRKLKIVPPSDESAGKQEFKGNGASPAGNPHVKRQAKAGKRGRGKRGQQRVACQTGLLILQSG